MSQDFYDVIIIGGGITGLTAANAITRGSNLNIALVEGEGIGSNNPSPLTFAEVLEAHDLQDCAKANYSSFVFHNYHGSIIRYCFEGCPLAVLDYGKACSKLFSRLKESRNDIMLIDRQAVVVSQDLDSVEVELEDGHRLNAKVLIDCSGSSQFVTAQLTKKRVSYNSLVYGAIFSGVKDIESDVGYFLWPCQDFGSGGGWFYPLENGRASFGYATISTSSQLEAGQLKDRFQRAFQEFQPYSHYLANGRLETFEKGIIPITYVKQFIHDRIIIAGDAGGMATNWTCMGIEPALRYGKHAGEIAAEALVRNDFTILNKFQDLWEKDNKQTFDLADRNATVFWFSDHYFWEWIIKNDLAFLSPDQLISRMRKSDHLLTKSEILSRSIKFKIKSLLNKEVLKPHSYVITS